MKFFLHFPLFLIILVIYNIALFAKRDELKAAPPAQAVVEQVAPAPTQPTVAPEPVVSTPPAPVPAPTMHPLDQSLFSIPLPSGAKMPVSVHEFLLILAVIFLYLELFKSTRTSNATIVEHVFSLLVFMAFFVELIVYRPAGTPTFFIMTLLAFLDVIAGFTITISTARRDFGMGAHAEGAA